LDNSNDDIPWCSKLEKIPAYREYSFDLTIKSFDRSGAGFYFGIFKEENNDYTDILNSSSLLYNPLGVLWDSKDERKIKETSDVGDELTLWIDIYTESIAWFRNKELIEVLALPKQFLVGTLRTIIYLCGEADAVSVK